MIFWWWIFLWWLFVVGAALGIGRALLLRRPPPPARREPFEGALYRVGRAWVAERASREPHATVVCMHGFCEDPRYFTRYYADPGVQLILIASGGYRVTLAGDATVPAWAVEPAEPLGSIEYDAEVLAQALAQLPRTGRVRVHGHSRGGAVALEAAARHPELFRDVELVLEAPVLPGARPRRSFSPAARWLFPFLLELWRLQPISALNRPLWGPLENARKREVIAAYPFNGNAAVYVRNLESLERWVRERDHELYRHLHRGTVLVPANDRVLDPVSMEAAARRARTLETVRIEGCSHFVLFDRPDAVPPLRGARDARAAAPG